MNEPSSKTPLISKGWIQAVALVMLFGFFTMGLLAYYTYTDEPPIPATSRGRERQGFVHRQGHHRRSANFPQKRADGIWLHFRPRRVAGAGLHGGLSASRRRTDDGLLRRFRFGHGPAADHHRFQNQPLRRGDGRVDHQRGAGRRLSKNDRLLRGLFRNAHDEIRSAAQCHHRPGTNPAAHGLFQLVGLGGVHLATAQKLFLHEQLAARIARRQSCLGGHPVLERALA